MSIKPRPRNHEEAMAAQGRSFLFACRLAGIRRVSQRSTASPSSSARVKGSPAGNFASTEIQSGSTHVCARVTRTSNWIDTPWYCRVRIRFQCLGAQELRASPTESAISARSPARFALHFRSTGDRGNCILSLVLHSVLGRMQPPSPRSPSARTHPAFDLLQVEVTGLEGVCLRRTLRDGSRRSSPLTRRPPGRTDHLRVNTARNRDVHDLWVYGRIWPDNHPPVDGWFWAYCLLHCRVYRCRVYRCRVHGRSTWGYQRRL